MKKIRLIGNLLSALRSVKPKRKYLSAIILAAGSGSRMNADKTKQWLEIEGIPVVVRSLLQFEACKAVKEIILVVKDDELKKYDGIAERYGLKKLKKTVSGGSTRQLSALEGFKKISDKSTHVAVHDAARCLITPEMIEKTARAAFIHGGSVASCKAIDTVKLADDNSFIEKTPDRRCAFLATTPQIFETEIYRASVYLALKDKLSVTDDASMVEHAGFAVKLVDIGRENIKITEKQDLFLAEAILNMRMLSKF